MAQLLTLPPDKSVHILFSFLYNTMNLFIQSVNLKSYALVLRHIIIIIIIMSLYLYGANIYFISMRLAMKSACENVIEIGGSSRMP